MAFAKTVEDLDVYKRALKILPKLYRLASQLPRQHIRLKSQIIASGEAVPPLLAEGFGRKNSTKELRRFARMSMGSSDETITHAREIYIVSKNYKSINRSLCIEVGKEYKIISKQLNTLIKNWKK